MTSAELYSLTKQIAQWYERTIPPHLIKDVWQEALAAIPLDVARDALKRYARQQRNSQPPSLDDLLKHCEDIQDERHRAATQARRSEEDRKAMEAWQRAGASQSLPPASHQAQDVIGQVLQHAAHDPYALAHVEMHEAGINRPGQEEAAIAFCAHMAEEQPEHFRRWMDERHTYQLALEQRGRQDAPTSTPQRPIPIMTPVPAYVEIGDYTHEPGDEDF